MKKVMKIFVIGIMLALATFTYDIKNALAATGTLSISASSSATVGSNFTVTIKATGSKIFYWQFYVSYDASKLKLVSGNTTIQGEADDATNGTSYVSKTLTFKALSTGSSYVSVARGDATLNIDANFNSISYTTVRKTININPVIPKSTNNSLSSLSIDGATLSPAFNADVTNYTAEIAAGTTEVNVNASVADSKASVTGAGKVAVVEGLNTINVVATAENGSTKTYVIAATVKELTPIEVKVDDKTYTVVRKKGLYEIPINTVETSIKIGEEDVLAYTNDKIKCTIVGLRNESGKIYLFIYDSKTNTYLPYYDVTIVGTNLYLKEVKNESSIPVGYEHTSVKINDKTVNAWNYDGSSKFYLLYGVNTLTGDESYYLYDKDKSTISRFYNDQVKDLTAALDQQQIILIVVSGVAGLFVFISILLLIKSRKKKKDKVIRSTMDDFMEKTANIEEQLKKGKKKK